MYKIYEELGGKMPGSRFKIGDIVKNKSGGPEMKVVETPHPSINLFEYICVWDEGDKVEDDFFREEDLILVEESKGN